MDTVVGVETPEGILLELRPAGLSVRFYALVVDWIVRLAIAYAALLSVSFLAGIGTFLTNLCAMPAMFSFMFTAFFRTFPADLNTFFHYVFGMR